MDWIQLYAGQLVNKLYWAILGNWLWSIYRFGPQITSWGFWAGLSDEELCARLSPLSQTADWFVRSSMSASPACVALIQRSYQSFAVVVHTLLYVCAIYYGLRLLFQSMEQRSMAKKVAQELQAFQIGVLAPHHQQQRQRNEPA